MSANRKSIIDGQLSSCSDKNATTGVEKARSLNEITPEKAMQINSAEATEGNYLAKPDPAYNYTHSDSADNSQDKNVVAGQLPRESASPPQNGPPEIAGQKPVAPQNPPEPREPQIAGTKPTEATSTKPASNEIAGQKPSSSQSAPRDAEPQIAGQKPVQSQNAPASSEPQIAGTTPDKRQDFDINAARVSPSTDNLSNEASKGVSNSVNAGAGIT